ncbi:HIT family protein [soil metagenome]
METIFTKIVKGHIPAHKVAEDDRFLAFLDVNPLVTGHTLVVPKEQVDYIFDLEEDQLADLHRFSQKVAQALKKAIPCNRIGVAVIGLEVPHAHIHLIPINSMSDMNFANPKMRLSQEALEETARKIREHL